MKEKFVIKLVYEADQTAYLMDSAKEEFCRKPREAKKFETYPEAANHCKTLQSAGYYNIEKLFVPA